MRQKRTNLVEGRLGIPAVTQQEAAGEVPKKKTTNYGVERLGFASREDRESAKRAERQQSPKKRETHAPPDEAPPKPKVSAILKHLAAQAEQVKAETTQQPDTPKEAPVRAVLPLPWHRRKWLLLAASVGGVVAVVLILLVCWGVGGDNTTPQAASASDGASTGAAHAGSGQTPSPTTKPARGGATVVARPRPAAPPSGTSAGPSSAVALSKMAFAEALKLLDQSRQGVPKAGSEGPAATPPTSSGRKTVSAFRVAPPGISVSGIIQGPEGPVAMINNRIVVVGDTVNKHKVVRIGKTSVELERDGKRFLVGISTPGARSSPVQDVPEDDEEPPAEGK